jgi:hypothetical protein
MKSHCGIFSGTMPDSYLRVVEWPERCLSRTVTGRDLPDAESRNSVAVNGGSGDANWSVGGQRPTSRPSNLGT